jgi:hypothetical protein
MILHLILSICGILTIFVIYLYLLLYVLVPNVTEKKMMTTFHF